MRKCKDKMSTQGNGGKRSRINESGDYTASTNPDTPTSVDMGCSSQHQSDGSIESKGKGKAFMLGDSFQHWIDVIEKMNLTRSNECAMEIERMKYERESDMERLRVESEKVHLEKVKEERRKKKIELEERKVNLELFKVLESKDCLTVTPRTPGRHF